MPTHTSAARWTSGITATWRTSSLWASLLMAASTSCDSGLSTQYRTVAPGTSPTTHLLAQSHVEHDLGNPLPMDGPRHLLAEGGGRSGQCRPRFREVTHGFPRGQDHHHH